MGFVLQYIDVIWLVVAFFVVRKQQRWQTIALLVGCMVLMRMQVELMYFIGYPHGLIGLIPGINAFERGLGVYSLFYISYFIFLHYSKETTGSLQMAASIGMFFMVFVTSTMLMVL